MEKEIKKPEWCPNFFNKVLEYYNLEQEALPAALNVETIRRKYDSQSTKARKNRRREVRDVINNSYKKPAILYNNEGQIVKESDYGTDTELLIRNVVRIDYFYPKHWWDVIKEAGHEKDFIWTQVKEGHGGWTWKETRITHIPLNIYSQS